MRVYACQFDIAWEDKPANFAKVRRMLRGAAIPRGSLVVLPEMFAVGFSMNVAGIWEDEEGPTHRFLRETARELGVFILGGVVARAPEGPGRNLAVVYSPTGERVASYQKIHPFTSGGETAHYERGEEIVLFDWQGVSVAPFICYDVRFPEVFRAAVLRGAQVYTVIASWPAHREDVWATFLRARAIENQAYVAGVNRCGDDPNLPYSGRSLIISPRGEVLADAGSEETVVGAEIDLAAQEAYRRELPVLKDMRRRSWY
ncbi:MAG: carbon-nitrogen family hydrolase [Armatimonadetes bacterium]|nr:carbon-nitrogen family hydrolase [Armatimonadota bacterium]